jgi:calcineurin-like phosphoesterase family protein
MIYFTADLHFGHTGIIAMRSRPFAGKDEMNEALVQYYNATVHNNDTCYILGDVAHKQNRETTARLVKRLNGRKVLIRGNHDGGIGESLFDAVSVFETISCGSQVCVLMHYPMLAWPKSRHGSLMLHGHLHSGPEYNEQNRAAGILRYDVGVDANNYCPVSFEQIRSFFGI